MPFRSASPAPPARVLLALLVGLGSGGAGPASAEEVEEVRSPKDRLRPGLDREALQALAGQDAAFACALYQALAATGASDLCLSPHGVARSLALAYAGARGDTEAEMAASLRVVLPQGRLHAARNALDRALASRALVEGEPRPFRLHAEAGVWLQRGPEAASDYLDVLALHYGAGLRLLDFAGEPRVARGAINAWLTEAPGAAEPLVGPGDAGPDTRLLLVSDVRVEGTWERPFDPARTRDGAFRRLDGTVVTAPLMQRTGPVRRARLDDLDAVELTYRGDTTSCVLLLPRAAGPAGLAALEASLTAGRVTEVLTLLAGPPEPLDLVVPGCAVTRRYDLEHALRALGMNAPFDPAADFTGIAPGGDLALDGVLHRAAWTLAEGGTQRDAPPPDDAPPPAQPEATLRLDRPFVFLVVDRPTGAILLLGRILDPTE